MCNENAFSALALISDLSKIIKCFKMPNMRHYVYISCRIYHAAFIMLHCSRISPPAWSLRVFARIWHCELILFISQAFLQM